MTSILIGTTTYAGMTGVVTKHTTENNREENLITRDKDTPRNNDLSTGNAYFRDTYITALTPYEGESTGRAGGAIYATDIGVAGFGLTVIG